MKTNILFLHATVYDFVKQNIKINCFRTITLHNLKFKSLLTIITTINITMRPHLCIYHKIFTAKQNMFTWFIVSLSTDDEMTTSSILLINRQYGHHINNYKWQNMLQLL